MTDVQNTPNAPTQSPELEQSIAQLKKQADRLGIQYKSNTSYATLQKAVSDALNAPTDTESNEGLGEEQPQAPAKAKDDPAKAAYDNAMKLVRVIITPMEATKASNLESEVFTAGNSVVGTVKRLIQFGEPWHVEQILLNSLQEKKYQLFTSKKDARGVVHTKARSVKAYNIAILDPLTPEEMAELADRQIRTRALLDDE
jgi:hypothetical protein